MRRARLLALGLTGLLVGPVGLAACGSEDEADASLAGGTLTILATDPPVTLDPGRVNTASDLLLTTRLMQRTLTTYPATDGAEGKEVVADLAEEPGEPNDDATEWTFRLKPDLTYTDGTPITADDIEHAVERTFAPGLDDGLPYARDLLADTEGYTGPFGGGESTDLSSVEATDERTITFRLRQPTWDFPYVVALPQFAPVPADRDTREDYALNPVTSGPYRIVSDGMQRLSLERSDFWTGDDVRHAYPDRVELLSGLAPEEITRRLVASEGSDATSVSGRAAETDAATTMVVSDPEVLERSARGYDGALSYLAMDTTAEPFTDLRVRRAMQYAVDRKAVQDAAGGSVVGGDPTTTILTPQIPGRRGHDAYGAGPTGDPGQAADLLELAGYPDGFATEMVASDSTRDAAVAQAVVDALARSGIQVTLRVLPRAEFLSEIGSPESQPPLVLASWQPDWPSGAAMLPPMFDGRGIRDTGNTNLSQLNSATVDQAMDAAAQIEDDADRNAAWAALDATIMDLAPIVPLLSDKSLYLAGEGVGNVWIHARYGSPDPAAVTVRGPTGGSANPVALGSATRGRA
jgi:peptide/nickel transport system substrate-binding protein